MGDLKSKLNELNKKAEERNITLFQNSFEELKKELTNNGFFEFLENKLKKTAEKGCDSLNLNFFDSDGIFFTAYTVSFENSIDKKHSIFIKPYLKHSSSSFLNFKSVFSLKGLSHLAWEEQLHLAVGDFCIDNGLNYYWIFPENYPHHEEIPILNQGTKELNRKILFEYYSNLEPISNSRNNNERYKSIKIFW